MLSPWTRMALAVPTFIFVASSMVTEAAHVKHVNLEQMTLEADRIIRAIVRSETPEEVALGATLAHNGYFGHVDLFQSSSRITTSHYQELGTASLEYQSLATRIRTILTTQGRFAR